jgi:TPR repeat protein
MHFYKLSKMDYQKLKEANEKFAFEQLKIDADKGHLFCQYQITIGTERNLEKAFEYYAKAANQRHAISQLILGRMYDLGIGTTKNEKKAFEYFEKAANQGLAIAQCSLGKMYFSGQGTAKNLEKAFEYFEKAANQGYDLAQFQLGYSYKNGSGTAKNLEKAFEYYEKAANQGLAEAKIELEKLLSSKCESANPSSAQLTQPIQPIAVKRPFILDISESSAFSSAKKQTIQID